MEALDAMEGVTEELSTTNHTAACSNEFGRTVLLDVLKVSTHCIS